MTPQEREALIKVRDGLRSGTLVHTYHDWDENGDRSPNSNKPHGFNMGHSCIQDECGTIACIGGWMGLYLGMNRDGAADFVMRAESRSERENEFYHLFFGNTEEDTTAAEAADAIDRFLADPTCNPWVA